MVVGSAPMVGDAAAQSQETPAQRCARQTAEYNQAQEALWRASHPGQQLVGQPWPPYVCADVPSPSVPVSPGGGSGATPGTGQVPGRTHRWDGFGGDQGQYADDMRLGDLGSPHTGLADRMDNRGQSSGAEAAPESARSNVPSRVPRWVSVDDGRGSVRSVRVVDGESGPMVVDDRGVATGEVVVDDPIVGNRVVSGGAGVAGQQLAGPRRDDAPAASPTERTQPRPSDGMDPSLPAGGVDDSPSGEDDEPGIGDAGRGPVAPLGAAGVLAGMAAALVRGRRGRGGPGGREAPRVSVRYPWGTEQTVFMLTSPESDRVQRFALDVPEGGRAYVRDDGGVDVVDADGRVVRQVDRPWAFDAAGRPVATHYEVDPDSGDLVQVVEPSDDAVYPIVADPKTSEIPGQRFMTQSQGDTVLTSPGTVTTYMAPYDVYPAVIDLDSNDQTLWSGTTGGISIAPDGSQLYIPDENATGYLVGGYNYQVRATRARAVGETIVTIGEQKYKAVTWKYDYEYRVQRIDAAREADGGVIIPIINEWSEWRPLNSDLRHSLVANRVIVLPTP